MINIDTHFFLEARHVDFMTTIKDRSRFVTDGIPWCLSDRVQPPLERADMFGRVI